MTHFLDGVASARRMIGYRRSDEDMTKATAGVLLPHVDAVAESFYRELVSLPEVAAYFSFPDGRRDGEQLARQVDTLKAWLRRVVEKPLDDETLHDSAAVGQLQTRGRERGTRGAKGRYLVLMMSYLLTAFSAVLEEVMQDRVELAETIVAWSKLLTIHLDLMLAVEGAAAGTPHWY